MIGGSVALLVAESAWLALVLDALADGTAGPGRPEVALPFLAVALPGVAAVLLATALRGRALVVAVVAAAVTAELVAGLTPGVAIFAAPAGQVAVRATTWAAIVAVLAWGRGTWLGLAPPSVNQAAVSMVLGWVVVLYVLFRRAVGHTAAFGAATSDAGWLLAVFFLAASAALAWAQVQSVRHAATRRPGAGPGAAWLTVMGVPLVLVTGVAFLLGGAASVAPALAGAARAVARGLNSAAIWLFARLPDFSVHLHPHPVTPSGGRGFPSGRSAHGSNLVVTVLAAGVEAVAALGVLALVVYLVSLVVRRLRRQPRVGRPDEERTSVFSWGHFWAQVLAWLRHRHRRPEAPAAPPPVPPDVAAEPDLDPVRAAYRRFLCAAEAASVGRDPAETPRELAGRLTLDRRPLGTLTGAYERARYGEREEPGSEAMEAAEALALELSRRSPEGASPDPS